MSYPRKRVSTLLLVTPSFWFPAFAGKTSCVCHTRLLNVIPAQAGIHSSFHHIPFYSFPLSRERHRAFVIPAQAGIHPPSRHIFFLVSRFRGKDIMHLSYPPLYCHTRVSGYPLFLKSYPLFWFPAFAGKTSCVLSYPPFLMSYPRKRVSTLPSITSLFIVSRFRGKDIVCLSYPHKRVSTLLLSYP